MKQKFRKKIKARILISFCLIALFAVAAVVVDIWVGDQTQTTVFVLIALGAGAVICTLVLAFRLSLIISEHVHWLESLLDSIPFPISVTDMDMNWTFINKPVEQMLGIKREEVLGKACENWNANICRTKNCGIARLRAGEAKTYFEQLGLNFQVDSAYITNRKGEQVGHIEVVQDITSLARGKAYSAAEVEKIAQSMKNLADGSLRVEYQVAEADQYTQDEKQNFDRIRTSFQQAVGSIVGMVSEASGALQEISAGNLAVSMEHDFKGEFTALKDSISGISDSLNRVMSEIHSAADQVAAGTRQVSDGNQEISQGATEQASAIEQLTGSLTEIAGQTRQNAENANAANTLTHEATAGAAAGNEQMRAMQTAMTEIEESSRSISKIIKVIDDIAFQTNILALNAAVEAARAGVHGKGFAVVAEEVRNLAARSASAAKETTELIEGSIRKTAAGAKIADDTAESLAAIVEGVRKAAQLVSEITEASNEQASAIAQVNRGIEQLTTVVQTNSATSEEAAAAAEELSSQAEMLKALVGRFQLKDGVRKAVSAPAKKKAIPAAGTGKILLEDGEFGKY